MNTIWYSVCYLLRTAILTIVFLNVNIISLFGEEAITKHFPHPVFEESDIYVVTNRATDASDARYSFTNKVSKDPSLKFFRVNASCCDSIRLMKLDSTSFLSEIIDIKKQDWVLYLHGDDTPFEYAVMDGLDIQNTYKVRVILFSWPSKSLSLSNLKNLENSYRNIAKSANHFYSLIRTMYWLRKSKTDFLKGNKLTLFVHSLGNLYLENMVNEDMSVESQPLLFDNVIINASAVDEQNHKKWVEKLRFQNKVYITYNKRDFNLFALRFFDRRGIKLGEKIKYPLADNALYFNFTKSVGFRLRTETTHTYFIGKVIQRNNNIRHFYSDILHGLNPDLADETRFMKRRESICDVL